MIVNTTCVVLYKKIKTKVYIVHLVDKIGTCHMMGKTIWIQTSAKDRNKQVSRKRKLK